METLQVVIGLGVAIVGVGIAGTTLVMTTLHRWKGDICKDIQSVKTESRLSHEELKEYLETKEKIMRELGERLSRVEGRNIERDTNTTHRDSMAYNSKQKEVHFDDE